MFGPRTGADGSPPRVWGLRSQDHLHDDQPRFTPTRVGTARGAGRVNRDRQVHPHACGDCSALPAPACPRSGSPPRVWGLPRDVRRVDVDVRFTPTRVGTAASLGPCCPRLTVHPHACGDCGVMVLSGAAKAGSPPRVWGLRRAARDLRTIKRFTPTRVGTANDIREWHRVAPVHPHACGDCVADPGQLPAQAGSPPRVWGLQPRVVGVVAERRFTPTRVGTAATEAAMPCCDPGSPPRVWGLPASPPRPRRRPRFTPTRVGTASSSAQKMRPYSVHPHACGDCDGLPRPPKSGIGSPPRVWGLPIGRQPEPGWQRFTPTRVGTASAGHGRITIIPVHPHACGDCVRVDQ